MTVTTLERKPRRFEDFEIRVGNVDVTSGGAIDSNSICHTMPTDLYCNQPIYTLFCQNPMEGRFVTIQKIGKSQTAEWECKMWLVREIRFFV